MQKKYLIAGLPAVLALAASAQAANIWTWTGTDSANWSDPANWLNASSATGVPTTGDTVVLTGQGANAPTNQDISGLSVANVTTKGTLPSSFTLSGSALTISAGGGSYNTGFSPAGTAAVATLTAVTGNTVTLVTASDANNIAVGDSVSVGSGIPNNTTVTGVDKVNGIVTLSTTVTFTAGHPTLYYANPTTWDADMTVLGLYNGPANTTINGNLTLSGNASWFSNMSFGIMNIDGSVNIGTHTLTFAGGRSGNYSGCFLNVNGNISGSGTLSMSTGNNNMVKFDGDNSGFTGTILLGRGALSINSDAALGQIPATPTNEIVAGATGPELDFTGNSFSTNANRDITVNTGGLVFNAQSGTTYTVGGIISDAAGTTMTGRVGNGANLTSLSSEQGGTIILAGQNTFTGGLQLYQSSEIGVTSDGGFGAVPGTFQANNIYFNSAYNAPAKLNFPDSMTINAIRGITMGGGGATGSSISALDVNPGAIVNYAGVFANNSLQTGAWTNSLQKLGSGTFVLSPGGLGSYSGNTFIGGGTLLINGTLDNTGTTVYTSNAASGTTFGILGGNGTINRPVTIARNSASGLAPGAGGIGSVGTLTVGNFTINSGNTTNIPTWYVDLSGSSSDELAINGNFTFAAGGSNLLDIDLNSLGSLADGQYTLATWSGTSPTAAISQYILDYGNTGLTSDTAGLAYGDSSLVLNVTGVPEPASLGLLALSATGLLMRRRRRREVLN